QGVHFPAYGGGHIQGVTRSADDEVRARCEEWKRVVGRLVERKIELRLNALDSVEAEVFDVRDDPHDFDVRILLAVARDVVPEWFFVRKLLAAESLVNTRDRPAVLRVFRGEEPAFD